MEWNYENETAAESHVVHRREVMLRGLRCFSSEVASGKSLLATLRKRTGLPIVKCKEALTRHQNDLDEAEKWLSSQAQKEGWAKVESLQGRSAKQGLIGIMVRDCKAAMVEVNCETDFVARNRQFRDMVSSIAMAIYDQKISPSNEFPCWEHFTKDDIHATRINDSERQTETVADVIAKNVGDFSENLVVSRGCTLSALEGHICSYAYNNVSENAAVTLGTYGALVHLLPIAGAKLDSQETVTFGNKLCQHIIGMKPLAVTLDPDPGNGIKESEALVKQPFIFDEAESVGDLLRRNSLQVTNFVRYGLGESS